MKESQASKLRHTNTSTQHCIYICVGVEDGVKQFPGVPLGGFKRRGGSHKRSFTIYN